MRSKRATKRQKSVINTNNGDSAPTARDDTSGKLQASWSWRQQWWMRCTCSDAAIGEAQNGASTDSRPLAEAQ